MIFFIWIFTLCALLNSYYKDDRRTTESVKKSFLNLKKILLPVFLMVVLTSAILALVPQDKLMTIFGHKDFASFATVALIGAIVTIPGPVAFPLAGALLKMGVPLPLLASFITTLTMVGIVTAPLEMTYFGRRFTLMRQSLSFVSALFIGLLMGVIL